MKQPSNGSGKTTLDTHLGDSRGALKYIRSALELRDDIALNYSDFTFAHQEHGTIRYLLDSNTIRFFLAPFKELNNVRLYFNVEPSIVSALSVVIAEYLFSRNLCGQWGAPALISPSHANELQTYAKHLIENVRSPGMVDQDDDMLLKERISRAINNSRRPEELERSIEELFRSDSDVRRIISNNVYEARMFARVAREDLVDPLYLDALATSEVLFPGEPAIDNWIRLISEQRHLRNVAKRTDDDPLASSSRNDRADAETLCQIVLLNEAAKDTNRAIRYVLVTLDQSLYAAVVKWYRSSGTEAIDFFPIRRIGQYAPLINMAEMPNDIQTQEPFRHVQQALDVLLSGIPGLVYSKTLGRDNAALVSEWSHSFALPHENARLARRISQKIADPGLGAERLGQTEELWSKLARDSVYLNARLLSRRITAFSELANFLAHASDVREAVVWYMEETIEKVESAHVEFVIEHQLAAAIEGARPLDGSSTRSMFLMRTRFGELTGQLSLHEYLDLLIRTQDRGALKRIYEIISTTQTSKTLLFAGCLAFWAGAWVCAHVFAERAYNRYKRRTENCSTATEDGAELTYFRSVATRYLAMDVDGSFEERRNLLILGIGQIGENGRIAREIGNEFLVMRAEIEEGLSRITLAYVLGLSGAPGGADEAISSFRRFSSCVPKLGNVEAYGDRILWGHAATEVYVGLAGCAIYNFFFDGKLSRDQIEGLRYVSGEIEELLKGQSTIVPKVYSIASLLLDIMYEEGVDKRQRLAIEAQGRMSSEVKLGEGITRLDRLVMEHLADNLAEAMERWSPGVKTYS